MRRLAWGLAVVAVGLQIASHIVYLAADALELVTTDIFTSAFAIAFSGVGVLVATRHPGNAIGWIFLGVAISTALGSLAHGVVEYGLRDSADPGSLVGAAAAYADVSWVPFVLIPATFLLLLFPDGRLPSRRWRLVAWCAGAGIVGVLLTSATRPDLEDFPTVTNPFASDSPVLEPLSLLSFLLLFVGVVGSAASVIVRFRRAGSVQRAQIKWLAAAGAFVAVVVPVMVMPLHDVVGEAVANGTIMFTVLGLPVAAGIAILRHRLYDIDVVINRALVYGALTATLAAAYLGSVLLLQLGLDSFTKGSALPVAASTLAVAGLFRPVRARIQATVDRRFFRRKYDAQLTLARFSAHLRDEVDLEALDAELRGVVVQTVQPAHVSLWLRAR